MIFFVHHFTCCSIAVTDEVWSVVHTWFHRYSVRSGNLLVWRNISVSVTFQNAMEISCYGWNLVLSIVCYNIGCEYTSIYKLCTAPFWPTDELSSLYLQQGLFSATAELRTVWKFRCNSPVLVRQLLRQMGIACSQLYRRNDPTVCFHRSNIARLEPSTFTGYVQTVTSDFSLRCLGNV